MSAIANGAVEVGVAESGLAASIMSFDVVRVCERALVAWIGIEGVSGFGDAAVSLSLLPARCESGLPCSSPRCAALIKMFISSSRESSPCSDVSGRGRPAWPIATGADTARSTSMAELRRTSRSSGSLALPSSSRDSSGCSTSASRSENPRQLGHWKLGQLGRISGRMHLKCQTCEHGATNRA